MIASKTKNLLEVSDLWVHYPARAGQKAFAAVKSVSFGVPTRKTMGLVGESGSGKSSTALAVMRLIEPSFGTVRLGDVELTSLTGRKLRQLRPKFQMIFQDPASSLNPRLRVQDILTEPRRLCGLGDRQQRLEIAAELLEKVGLSKDSLRLLPHQFSGGQRQRLVIARALSTSPELIVADEPVSALDVAVQAQILNLLAQLRENFGLTVLFISHDLGVIQHACHEVGVMYRGRLVERAAVGTMFAAPAHPYTWALLSASVSDWGLRAALTKVFGPGLESAIRGAKLLKSPSEHMSRSLDSGRPKAGTLGCDFLACPLMEERCLTSELQMQEFEQGHFSRCRLASEVQRQGAAILELAEIPPVQRFNINTFSSFHSELSNM
jgi:peptide/nickel transport system ATP-binding protein